MRYHSFDPDHLDQPAGASVKKSKARNRLRYDGHYAPLTPEGVRFCANITMMLILAYIVVFFVFLSSLYVRKLHAAASMTTPVGNAAALSVNSESSFSPRLTLTAGNNPSTKALIILPPPSVPAAD